MKRAVPFDFDLDEPLYRHFEIIRLGATTAGRRLRQHEARAARQAFQVLHLFEDRAELAERARRGDERIHFERERFCRLLVRRAQRGGAGA